MKHRRKHPSVALLPVAYGMPWERLVEFQDGEVKGRISIQRIDGNDGNFTITVHVFGHDPNLVEVSS